jgi:hypothetical protein
MDDISKLISYKKSQFILLSMERIKEEDKYYLNTLDKDELIKIRDNIKNYCKNIYDNDKKIFNICNNTSSDYVNKINPYLQINNTNNIINTLIKTLMTIPLNDSFIETIKSSNIFNLVIKDKSPEKSPLEFIKPLLVIKDKSPEKPKGKSPEKSPDKPKGKSPEKSPEKPPEKFPEKSPEKPPEKFPDKPKEKSQNSESIELVDDPNKKQQCNIVLILIDNKNLNPYLKAIFNYGIYKKKLDIIFRQLIGIYNYIKIKINKENETIEMIIKNKNFLEDINYSDFNLRRIEQKAYNNVNNDYCIYKLYTYDNIKIHYTKYFLLLEEIYKFYIDTLDKSNFLNNINEYLINKNKNYITKAGWDLNIINHVIQKLNIKKKLTDDDFTNFLNKYIYAEKINNKINVEIIKKIFSKKISDFDPLYIRYTNLEITYKDLMSKNLNFNFYKTSDDNDKYIRIMKDSENNYINIFGEPSTYKFV